MLQLDTVQSWEPNVDYHAAQSWQQPRLEEVLRRFEHDGVVASRLEHAVNRFSYAAVVIDGCYDGCRRHCVTALLSTTMIGTAAAARYYKFVYESAMRGRGPGARQPALGAGQFLTLRRAGTRCCQRDAQPVGKPHQFGEGPRAHLPHDVT